MLFRYYIDVYYNGYVARLIGRNVASVQEYRDHFNENFNKSTHLERRINIDK